MARIVKAKYKVGFNKKMLSGPFNLNLTDFLTETHTLYRNLTILKFFNFTYRPELRTFSENLLTLNFKSKLPDITSGNRENNWVLLNLSVGDTTRNWTETGWISLTDFIVNKHPNFKIIINSLPTERFFAVKLVNIFGNEKVHIGTNRTVSELAAIVRDVDLVVSPDTAVVHLSTLFNKPILSLFPGIEWNLRKFAPLSEIQEVIVAQPDQPVSTITFPEVRAAWARIYQLYLSRKSKHYGF